MKPSTLSALVRGLFAPAIVTTSSFSGNLSKPIAGMVPDNQAVYGLLGAVQNINEATDMDFTSLSGGASTAITLTGAQFNTGVLNYSGTAGSGVTITTPTAALIVQAFPNTIPTDGYNFIWYFINDGSGQTVTLSGGSGVTVSGNNTIATNTMRQFLVSINAGANTVQMINMGTQNL